MLRQGRVRYTEVIAHIDASGDSTMIRLPLMTTLCAALVFAVVMPATASFFILQSLPSAATEIPMDTADEA